MSGELRVPVTGDGGVGGFCVGVAGFCVGVVVGLIPNSFRHCYKEIRACYKCIIHHTLP